MRCGILPWLEDNNSYVLFCREEFPEEEVDPGNTIPVPDENFDEVNASNTNQSEQDVNEAVDDIIQRLLLIRPITDTLPSPDQPLPPINLRHTIYVLIYLKLIIQMKIDPELQEAIRQSLINT